VRHAARDGPPGGGGTGRAREDHRAEGEALSAGRLAEAADVIADHPVALQLRNLQILAEIAAEKNSTIFFPAQLLDSAARSPASSRRRPSRRRFPGRKDLGHDPAE